MSTIYIFIAAIFWTGVVVWLTHYMFSLFNLWLFDYIQSWFNLFTQLFWSTLSATFLWMFGVAFLVLIVRFIMSWIGENPWHSANR
jgi:hypothetical protein